jgi:hypothetical protein
MSNEEEVLPTNIVLIGEPGYRKIVWGERQLREESSYDSFEEVREVAEDSDNFQYKELVRREDVEELVQGMLNEFKNNRDDAGALRPCDADIFEERLTKFLNEVQSE